jgi:hypothetical protein
MRQNSIRADVSERETVVTSQHLPTGDRKVAYGRLLVDAISTPSPFAIA